MNLLMIGTFPLMMTLVLVIAVWAERLLGVPPLEEPVTIDDPLVTPTPADRG